MKSAILAALATVAQFGVAASSIESFIGDGPGKVPGAVIVNLADGKLTTRCFGFADVAVKKPMTENTVGWLASNTKAIACALVLSYVEEGKTSYSPSR